MAVSEGMYELRSLMDTAMALGCPSTTKGVEVGTYAADGGNGQKFRLSLEDEGTWGEGVWRVQCVGSRLYVNVDKGETANGTRVIQWEGNEYHQQRWHVVDTGDAATVDGVPCAVVELRSDLTEELDHALDSRRAFETSSAATQLHEYDGSDYQRWALLPTTEFVGFAAPTGVGWSHDPSSIAPFTVIANPARTSIWLGWTMPSAWNPTYWKEGWREYERRYRTRAMDAASSTWGEWSGWSAWAVPDYVVRDQWCYDGNAIDPSFDKSEHRAVEFQAQVRCMNFLGHGYVASSTMRNIVDPTATLSLDHVAADGMHLAVGTDYAPAYYTVTAIDVGGTNVLSQPVSVQVLGEEGEVVIPWANLLDIPGEGESATATYTRGTDLFAKISGTKDSTFAISYGEGPEVEPTLTPTAGRLLDVTHPDGVSGVWVSSGHGVWGDEDGHEVMYQFGNPVRLLVSLEDGTMWLSEVPQQLAPPCHAFNWDGGSFVMDFDEDPLITDRTLEADYESLALNQRPWQTVAFTDTISSEFSVVGLLWTRVSESGVDDLVEMMRQQHVTYRAPSGEVADVAVVGASYQTHREFTKVEVNLIQETR